MNTRKSSGFLANFGKIMLNITNVTVYLDMDEVLCNFIKKACEVHEVNYDKVLQDRIETMEWSMVPSVRKQKGSNDFSDTEFWRLIKNQGISFWKNLEPLPWANSLVSLLDQYQINWYLVSAPADYPECYVGKLQWIQNFFGYNFKNYILTSHKELLARPGTLLVDDNHHTLSKYVWTIRDGVKVKSGGHGYLFPTSPVAFEQDRADPLHSFTQLLERLVLNV
jgi:5'(3')-deoxyribonucleotidase